MTKQRQDGHSTEFGLWLREQPELDSSLGFAATNLDYVWKNYKTGKWLLIEEKRYNGQPTTFQRIMFEELDNLCRNDGNYNGFHYVTFERTSPDDGKIFLDGKEITKKELISFLRLNLQ